ncbi:endonuclease/exonuclease/phosphatase family protein [Sulfitobacter aestuarii]|uniref:Endonuclease/exonuclease/phosphatase family protein n=1 Tax=Sulfitobacter aestuarii TaxID=2161676 RepID=A0ABW5U0Y4_9RHOB
MTASMRIASYNIRKAMGTDRRRDPDRILRIIKQLQADVVVLQEADRRRAPRPSALPLADVERLSGMRPVAVPNEVSIGWHGNAILVSREAEIGDVELLDLPGIEPRGAMVVDLRLRGQALRVIAVHLGLLRPSRKEQLTAMFDHLTERPTLPALIAGDMNEWSQKVGLGRLARHFTIYAPGKTFHARLPLAALDRIALDETLRLENAGVVETEETRLASDHLPIWVDVAPL